MARHYPEARWATPGELHLNLIFRGLLKMKSTFPLLFITICLATACSSTKPAVVEQPPNPTKPPQESTPMKMAVAAAPKLPEVEEAVKRVFKDAAMVHPDYKSTVLTGDFNGDLSQDLAVVLKPVPEKLAQMNEPFPSWLLRDPRVPRNPAEPLQVEKDEALLAVIHGYGTNDWRDPQATQTFLLKNAVGADMRVQNGKEFINNFSGRKLPRPQGDLIGENFKGSEGYIYYNAATYSWYDPKTFKTETEPTGVFHGKNRAKRTN
jgi:hypothetical protein